MLIVIQDREIFFPTYMTSAHNQGVKTSRDNYYNNFVFINLVESGNLPFIHNYYKAFRSPAIKSQNSAIGIYIDVMGSIHLLKTKLSITEDDDDSGRRDLVSAPAYYPIDVSINDGEWNIVAEYPPLHDYCAALLHFGLSPGVAIAKTLSAMGHPGNNAVSSLKIADIVKTLTKTYTKTDKATPTDLLYDLIKEPAANLR